jgi:hypothetical protein
LIGNRLYQAIMVGPASKVSEEELDHFVKSFELLQKVSAIASTTLPSPTAPSPSPTVVAQVAPPPPVSPPAQAVRPTPGDQGAAPSVAAQEDPPPPASPPAQVVQPAPSDKGAGQTVVAKQDPPPPARTVVRTMPNRTPPARPARDAQRTRAPAENRVAQAADSGPDPSKPAEVAIEVNKPSAKLSERPAPNGNPRDRFRDVAPERGVLVGLRVGYVDRFGGPKVGSIQPIFQVGDTYVEGKLFGGDIPPSMTVVARPGYTVGAINTHAGLLVDSFQVVFMRFKNGRLDPGDSYTTDWLGDPRGGGAATATGQGKLVVGIHGRSNGREINALGLLVAD